LDAIEAPPLYYFTSRAQVKEEYHGKATGSIGLSLLKAIPHA